MISADTYEFLQKVHSSGTALETILQAYPLDDAEFITREFHVDFIRVLRLSPKAVTTLCNEINSIYSEEWFVQTTEYKRTNKLRQLQTGVILRELKSLIITEDVPYHIMRCENFAIQSIEYGSGKDAIDIDVNAGNVLWQIITATYKSLASTRARKLMFGV